MNYLVNSRATFQTNTAIYLTAASWAANAQEAADLPVAKTETWSELLGAALGCHLFEVSVIWDPAAAEISGAGDAHHLSQATSCFAIYNQSSAGMSGTRVSTGSFSLLLHTDLTGQCTCVWLLPALIPSQ